MWAKIQKYRWTFNTWSEHDARWSQWKCKMPCRVAWNMNHDKYSCMDRYVSFFFGLFFFLLKFTSCSVFIGTCCWRKRNGKKHVIFITRVGLSFGILRNFLMNSCLFEHNHYFCMSFWFKKMFKYKFLLDTIFRPIFSKVQPFSAQSQSFCVSFSQLHDGHIGNLKLHRHSKHCKLQ